MKWAIAFAFYLGVIVVIVALCRSAGVKRPMPDSRRDGLYLEDGVADTIRDLGPVEPELARLNEREPDISPRDEAEAQAVAERVVANLQRQRDEWEADEFRRALGPNGGAS